MLLINGTDYGIILAAVFAFAIIAALQFFLCLKAKNKVIKLIPCVFGIFFIGAGIAAQFGSSGGFVDLRGFVTFICIIAACICFFAQALGWGIWKLKNKQ